MIDKLSLRTPFLILLLVYSFLPTVNAQEETFNLDSTSIGSGAYLLMDSIVITARRKGFDVESFVKHVLEDESFYFAFKNLRRNAYSFDMHTEFFDKEKNTKAEYLATHIQKIQDTCRTMETDYEFVEGDYYKEESKYNYYTSRLFKRAFLTDGTKCFPKVDTTMDFSTKNSSQLENQIAQLKKVIFSPGKATGLPVLGDKMAIFKEEMSKYYDYSLVVQDYKDFGECYAFKVEVKEKYKRKKKGKTVVKYMYTFFEKENLQIVGREYQVKHGLPLYSFDMTLDIVLTKFNDAYIPKSIIIDGFWDLLFKKPEIFEAEFFYYGYSQ